MTGPGTNRPGDVALQEVIISTNTAYPVGRAQASPSAAHANPLFELRIAGGTCSHNLEIDLCVANSKFIWKPGAEKAPLPTARIVRG